MKETLNIISESYNLDKVGGPNKVISNTIKGLTKIGFLYTINNDIRNYKYNWIHDSTKGLIEVSLQGIPAVIGPNIVVLPKDLPRFRPSLTNCIYLAPSQWCVDLWKGIGFSECEMQSWPVGVDSEDFNINRNIRESSDVMIYFKRRDHLLLNNAIATVRKLGLNPLVIKYGEYNEDQYKQVLSKSRFGIWIGVSESQGIGLQEALSSGLPLIVCNVNSLFESSEISEYRFPEQLRSFRPTSAPYFDDSCGIIIDDFTRLEEAINDMSKNLSFYNPREFVVKNLSLEKQAIELLSFFDNLKQRNVEYFSKPIDKKYSKNFKLSFRGSFSYLFFLLDRKTKTMLKIFKNRFQK